MRLVLAAMALALVAAAEDDPFDRAVRALATGVRAQDSHAVSRLRTAARDLRASDAQAVDGEDLAVRWLRQAGGEARAVDRNRALGPGYRSLQLDGGRSITFEQTFLAGQLARVAVIPSGGANFTMSIGRDDRTTLCNASRGQARCDWVPTYTSRFTIVILNPGPQAGRYIVVMQ